MTKYKYEYTIDTTGQNPNSSILKIYNGEIGKEEDSVIFLLLNPYTINDIEETVLNEEHIQIINFLEIKENLEKYVDYLGDFPNQSFDIDKILEL